MSFDVTVPPWAVRGAKVVCVAVFEPEPGITHDPLGLLRYPQTGEVYTVRDVSVRFTSERMDVSCGLLLAEIRNPPATGGSAAGSEMYFNVDGFRPVRHVEAERLEEALA